MIEVQAVARVIRLGQRKKVSIIRYIVKGIVEQASRMRPSVGKHLANQCNQTMRSQQQRKLALASLGWSRVN
jgi:SNF2 family DNA or RNA helicase